MLKLWIFRRIESVTDKSSDRVFTNNKTNYMQENGATTA